MPLPVRVFVSYSHDTPDHAARVLALANQLRGHGVDTRIDQYEPHPPEGWPRWMQRQVEQAVFVLLVCTPTFCRRFEGNETPGLGHGATWEGALVTIALYEQATHNTRFLPVLFDGEPDDAVPLILRSYTRYRIPSGWDALYRRLTGQPAIVPPPLGPVRPMPPQLSAPAPQTGAPAQSTARLEAEPAPEQYPSAGGVSGAVVEDSRQASPEHPDDEGV